MRFLTRAILIVAAVTLAAAASAQGPRPGGGPKPGGGGGGGATPGGTITGFNPDQIAQLFNSAGFKSQVVENNKAKMVQTLFWPDANDILVEPLGYTATTKANVAG
jgi:hypothetical protein